MRDSNDENDDRRLRIGSLFSGYGGLDLAVEHVFNADTVWFSELNEPVARVFSNHWPGVPNLGDITTINWHDVEPVDILIGGFPCQDVSTVGKRAGLAPGTRSGLWAHMAEAIDALQPEWVVIENVRGLLSSPATRPPTEGDDHDQRNPGDATLDGATLRGLEPQRNSTSTSSRRRYADLVVMLTVPLAALSRRALPRGGQHNWGLVQRSVRNAMSVSEAWYLAGGRFPMVESRSRVRRLSSRSAWR